MNIVSNFGQYYYQWFFFLIWITTNITNTNNIIQLISTNNTTTTNVITTLKTPISLTIDGNQKKIPTNYNQIFTKYNVNNILISVT